MVTPARNHNGQKRKMQMPDTTTTPQPSISLSAAQIAANLASITGGVSSFIAQVSTANIWTALLGLATAAPEIASIIISITKTINKITGNNPAAFIAKNGPLFVALLQAKTTEERQNAANTLASAIGHLPT
jgi:hypothetical protein